MGFEDGTMESASRMNDKWTCRSSSDIFGVLGLNDRV